MRELPEFQALADAYAGDPQVKVISIYPHGEQPEVSAWMRERGYTFDVLIAGDYCDVNKIDSFPTLWVLDRDSRIAFTSTGSDARLREEFTWRVESLRRRAG